MKNKFVYLVIIAIGIITIGILLFITISFDSKNIYSETDRTIKHTFCIHNCSLIRNETEVLSCYEVCDKEYEEENKK